MTVRLDHTIVAARDSNASAKFLTEILGLPAPTSLGHFVVVRVSDDTTLDYLDTDEEIAVQHYAFLVSELEFDEIFERIRERRVPYWADPQRREPGQINGWDDGRGLYFEDPSGHVMEIITRSYGSGPRNAARPNPLLGRG